MSDNIGENCGLCLTHTLHDAHSMINSLQHRGRDSCGIIAVSKDRIDAIKWSGKVRAFDVTDLHDIFPPKNKYHTFAAHVRYTTSGVNDLDQAHPHFIEGRVYNRKDHIIIEDCESAIVHNGQIDKSLLGGINSSCLKTKCDTEKLLHWYHHNGEVALLKKIPGAYTAIIADKKKKDVIVLRDRTGIKPGVIGWKDGKYLVASEDIAFRKNGAKLIDRLEPGFAYYFNPSGEYYSEFVVNQELSFCFFEFNYVSDRETMLEGVSTSAVAYKLGEKTAEEFLKKNSVKDYDFVSYLPRCPEASARGFSKFSGLPFVRIFYKKDGDRAFMGNSPEERINSIKLNLHILPDALQILPGARGLFMDDSSVRGTNMEYATHLLKEKGKLNKITFCSYTPIIGQYDLSGNEVGCEYGVDMPPSDNFISRDVTNKRNRTLEEISDKLGSEIFFISKQGMLDVFSDFGLKEKDLCTRCIGGKKPF